MIVIVDTLSFSTAVVTAVSQGAVIYPSVSEEEALQNAARVGGEVALRRTEVPSRGRFSLSPATLETAAQGELITLASPNGATCTRMCEGASNVFCGALVNAEAVGQAVTSVLNHAGARLTVVACGERGMNYRSNEGIRFALEDYLGAGAILSSIPFNKSPDAAVSAAAFLAVREDVPDLLMECDSGRELRDIGFSHDVEHASTIDRYDTAPVLKAGRFG